jgi:hypothetical protein
MIDRFQSSNRVLRKPSSSYQPPECDAHHSSMVLIAASVNPKSCMTPLYLSLRRPPTAYSSRIKSALLMCSSLFVYAVVGRRAESTTKTSNSAAIAPEAISENDFPELLSMSRYQYNIKIYGFSGYPNAVPAPRVYSVQILIQV